MGEATAGIGYSQERLQPGEATGGRGYRRERLQPGEATDAVCFGTLLACNPRTITIHTPSGAVQEYKV